MSHFFLPGCTLSPQSEHLATSKGLLIISWQTAQEIIKGGSDPSVLEVPDDDDFYTANSINRCTM